LDKRRIGLSSKVLASVVAGSLVLAQTSLTFAQGAATKPAHGQTGKPAPDAKPDLAAAKKHYAEGERLFKAGDLAGALSEFKQANDIKGTAHVERYIGLCEDGLGHYKAAAEWYDKFLAHVPEKLASQGEELKKRSAELRAMPGKVHVDSNPPGASVSIDDKPQAAPTPMDVELAPGSHSIKLSASGRTATTKAVDVEFASTQSVSADLVAEAAPAPAAPVAAPIPVAVSAPLPAPIAPGEPAEARSKVPAFVTGGLAIAAAGVGTVFGIIALGDKSNFDKNPTTATADSGDTHALIADMAFGVAVTFGVTSAVLFLTRDEPAATSSNTPKTTTAKGTDAKATAMKITPTPIVGPHTGGAGFVLQF
jgi:hypothetical protein